MKQKRLKSPPKYLFSVLITVFLFIVGLAACIGDVGEVRDLLGTALPSLEVPTLVAPPQVLATLGIPDLLSTVTPSTTTPAATPYAGRQVFHCLPVGTEQEEARLVDVIDGDTIDVQIDGKTYRVRYIGVDTPERGRPFYAEAAEKNRELLGNGQLVLVRDVSQTDRYGRLLRYVLVGQIFVNYELAVQGYAEQVTFPPDVACEAVFQDAVQEARGDGRGLWRQQ